MGIDFYKKNIEERVDLSTESVNFNEEIQLFLCEDWGQNKLNTSILLQIDPYGDTVFSSEGISEIIMACDLLYNEYKEPEIRDFVLKLKKLCEEAIKENKEIFAAGD
jgi:hypothetical protein